MKHFNNNTNDDDNTNYDTYDGKIRDTISDIRMVLRRLGNIVVYNDRKIIKKSFMKQKIKIFQIRKKKRIIIILWNQ